MENDDEYGFVIKAIIGGVIGGILSAVPILGWLNCCFCLLNGAGAGLGVSLHCRSDPGVRMSLGQGAMSGALSGVLASFIVTIFTAIFNFLAGAMFVSVFRDIGMPREVIEAMTGTSLVSFITSGCFNFVLYSVFGALYGMAALKFMHSDQVAE